MAATSKLLLNLITLLSLLLLLALTHSQTATSSFELEDEDDSSSSTSEEYILDSPLAVGTHHRLRSRFLASIKKGHQCDAKNNYKICNGVSADKGKSLLYCCKKHCRNVLGDRNNCGKCGNKCKLNERCCNGYCTNVLHNSEHCGKCQRKCSIGVICEYGYCGYA